MPVVNSVAVTVTSSSAMSASCANAMPAQVSSGNTQAMPDRRAERLLPIGACGCRAGGVMERCFTRWCSSKIWQGHTAFGGMIVRTPSPSAGIIRIRFDGFTGSVSQAKATPQVGVF